MQDKKDDRKYVDDIVLTNRAVRVLHYYNTKEHGRTDHGRKDHVRTRYIAPYRVAEEKMRPNANVCLRCVSHGNRIRRKNNVSWWKTG